VPAVLHGFTLAHTNAFSRFVFLTAADKMSSLPRCHLVPTPKYLPSFRNNLMSAYSKTRSSLKTNSLSIWTVSSHARTHDAFRNVGGSLPVIMD
jgi:hypothetical protein